MELTNEQLMRYRRDGFLIVPDLLTLREVELLREIARADRDLAAEVGSRDDGEGGAVRLVVRNDLPEDSIYGAIVRSERIVRPVMQLIGSEDAGNDRQPVEAYHWHHKMILKEPRTGGAWAWHQDYGYWYNDGCLAPMLASCMIAVDRATTANGCLQVLAGSHRLGRIDHGKVGQQTGADPERVAQAETRLERVPCELEPGSAIFFHSNLLHRSDQNRSDDPRWAFICCYNARTNEPYKPSKHPSYTPLSIWPHVRVREIGEMHHDRVCASDG